MNLGSGPASTSVQRSGAATDARTAQPTAEPTGLAAAAPRRKVRRARVANRSVLSRRERWIWGGAGMILVLGIWETLARVGILEPTVASSPAAIWESAVDLSRTGVLWPAVVSSGRLFAIGFVIALGIALVLGVVLGWYSRTSALLDPWVSILYAAPRLAFIPLIIVWAGVGLRAQIIMVILNTLFPILVNVTAGVRNFDTQLFRVAQSFGASNLDVLRTVALPGAVPFIVTGIRQGLMMALVGTVVAEYFVGNTGVGGIIFSAGLTLDTATAFVGAFVFSVAALVLSAALGIVEKRVEGWRQ